jgi:hypothetical protein
LPLNSPKNFEQVELSKEIFGKRAAYLTGMLVIANCKVFGVLLRMSLTSDAKLWLVFFHLCK